MGVLGEGAVGSRGPRPFWGRGVGTMPPPLLSSYTALGQNRFRKTSTVMSNDVQDCSCRVLTVQRAGYKTACAAQSYFGKKVILHAFN